MRSALLLATVLALSPTSIVQGQGTARDALDRFADGLVALSGRFEQRAWGDDGSLREHSQGNLALRAPRLFRWHYEAPYEQLVVADGSHVWLHDLDLQQVTVRRQADQEAESPLVVLTDPGSLDRRYDVSEGGHADGLSWLLLRPREGEDGFSAARLGFDAAGLLARMRIEDALGGHTEITFSAWQRNPALAADLFRFRPPPDADLVGDVDSVPEVVPLPDGTPP